MKKSRQNNQQERHRRRRYTRRPASKDKAKKAENRDEAKQEQS